MFYYQGLKESPRIKGFLFDTCLTAQDNFKVLLDYFHIKYRTLNEYQVIQPLNFFRLP